MKAVVKAFRRCRKDTDFYRLIIDLENRLSPLEFAELDLHRRRLPEQGREWLDRLMCMLTGEIPDPRPYGRTELGTHVRFYRSPMAAGQRRDLVIAFCGGAQRLMVPVGVALQHIDDGRYDMVVVTDPQRRAFVSGIEAYAETFDDIHRRLSADIDFGAYGSLQTLGTSQGGSASLRFGLGFGLQRATSIGGRCHPEHATSFVRRGETEIVCIHGDGNAEDRNGAQSLADALGGAAIPVAGIADHNILYEILKQGWLGPFFDAVLSGAVPAAFTAPQAAENRPATR